MRLPVVTLLLAAAAVSPLDAQSARVSTTPTRPVRGRLLTVSVRLPEGGRVEGTEGTLAGEPLHFAPGGRGRVTAIAAVPIDAPDTLSLTVVVARGAKAAARDTVVVPLTVVAGNYRTEQLRVAPEFGREPDSALARRIAEEGEKARAIGVAAHGTSRLWRSPFVLPRPGRVTSGFGTARTFNGAVQTRHMGVDFAGAVGAPVRVANRGVVALVADFYLAGRAIYVDHGDGLVTGYFHLSRASVAQGDTVTRGQVIGRVGSSGRVTGPHLHWVMRYGGITVDPRSVFDVAGGTVKKGGTTGAARTAARTAKKAR